VRARQVQMRRFVMSTGNVMRDQFKPWYFGIAFAFCFKYCAGLPDMPVWSAAPRCRRKEDVPRVELPLWAKLISRRAEQHLKRDWLLGFTMSDVFFRSLLNQCRTVYSYEKVRRAGDSVGFAAEELEAEAVSICKARGGERKDLDGSKKKVNGDLPKVKYASALTEAGRRLLQNLEHSSRQLKGTMEVRKMMRFDTRAGRIRRGVPIFATWSPDEKRNALMTLSTRWAPSWGNLGEGSNLPRTTTT
jgi:hypothetical protein